MNKKGGLLKYLFWIAVGGVLGVYACIKLS